MRMIRGAGLRGLGGDSSADSGRGRRRGISAARSCGLCLPFAGANWSSISRTSDNPGAKIRAIPTSTSRATACASWWSRCWSRSSILRWPRILPSWRRSRAGEEDYWENEVSGWLGTTVQWSEPDWARARVAASLVQIDLAGPEGGIFAEMPICASRIDSAPWLVMNASVSRMWFLGEPVAVQRRLVKAIGENAGIPLEFKHVEEILRFAAEDGPSGKELSLPLGWKVVREPEELVFVTPDLRDPRRRRTTTTNFPCPDESWFTKRARPSKHGAFLRARMRGIILITFWMRNLCPDRSGCGTGVRETGSGRPIRSPPRRSKSCCRSIMWRSRSASSGRWW